MKAQIEQLSREAIKPSSGSLFKSINGFLQLADMMRMMEEQMEVTLEGSATQKER